MCFDREIDVQLCIVVLVYMPVYSKAHNLQQTCPLALKLEYGVPDWQVLAVQCWVLELLNPKIVKSTYLPKYGPFGVSKF